MELKDAKLGEQVLLTVAELKHYRNGYSATKDIIATVVEIPHPSSYRNDLVTIAWLPEEENEKGITCPGHISDVNVKKFSKLTRGIQLINTTPCALVKTKAIEHDAALFLFACIGAGAGLSYYTKSNSQHSYLKSSHANS